MMSKTFKKAVVILVIIGLLLTGVGAVFGQTTTNEQERTGLEQRLKQIEAEILESERNLTMTQAERERFQYEVNTIKRRIDQLNAQIRQARATVQVLTGQISNTEVSIDVTIVKIEDLRWKLTGTLRTIYEEDSKSTVEILLSERNISEYFDNSLGLELLSRESRDILGEIMTLKINLEEEKSFLDGKRSETEQMARIQALQAEESERIRAAQEALLRDAQNREAVQKQGISELERQAAEIRSRIFELAGTPTTEAPTFGEAYEIAKWVEGRTGVRAAFILAVLHQESGIGRNVGQCYMKDPTTARGINIATGATVNAVMKPMGLSGRAGDVDSFLIITKELGLDPFNTPVSCPIVSVGGYGGAMGPAQFIPTTWMGYRARVASILGRPANPWIIKDAFLASGLYLSDYGAGQKTREAEWCAAQGYFTGRRCNPANAFYGDSVISIADRFQRDIDVLNR